MSALRQAEPSPTETCPQGASPARDTRRGFDLVASFIDHVRSPLHGNVYALILSSGANAVLGFAFWTVATRMFSPSTIGLNSGIVSAVLLLGGLSQFGLPTALMRFLPAAGAKAPGLVTRTYAACLAGGLVLGTVFLLGLQLWEPRLHVLVSSPGASALFVMAVLASSFFVLQDFVLIGLRQSKWVPVENIAANSVKIGLLIPAAVVMPREAPAAAWIFAGFLAIPAISTLIFGRLIPRHAARTPDAQPIDAQIFLRFLFSNYGASLLALASQTLMPLIVLSEAGPAQSAYFYVPWLVYSGLSTITSTASGSLLAEASLQPERAVEYARKFIWQMLRLLVPVATILCFGAPLILRIFGARYAIHGALSLRLLVPASVLAVVVAAYMSVLRVRHQNLRMLAMLVCQNLLAVGLSAALLGVGGINAAAACILVSQALFAGLLAVPLMLPRLAAKGGDCLRRGDFAGVRGRDSGLG